MNSNMVKPEKIDHLHLVYHFTVPLNNRPISYTYFESDLIEPITPNKLLYGQKLEVINIVNDTSPMVDLTVTKREQNLQAVLKHFGFRWTTEYLTELRQHQRRSNKNKRIK